MNSRTAPCHELLRQVEHHLGPVPPSSFHGWDGRLRFLRSGGGACRPLDHDVSTGKPLRGGGRARGTSSRMPAAMTVPIAKSFYDLSATTLQGEKVDFGVFRGRVVLIENVASL